MKQIEDRIKTLVSLVIAILCALGSLSVSISVSVTITPAEARMGWAGPEAVKLSEGFTAQQPQFRITDEDGRPVVQDNEHANVRLWKFVGQANGGSYPPNVAQQIGDCTSWGTKHAIEATQGSQIAVGRQPHSFRSICSMFTYGAARAWVLKGRIRGDGATGASVAEAAKTYGVLPEGLPGLPAYSGSIAKEWGRTGPPEQWKIEALKHRIKTTALLRSADEVRDAICNGYGVIICSDWGAEGKAAFREQDGRMVASRRGSWMHCMCVDGYDGSASQPYWHVQNSWGEQAHPTPIDDSPAGGFWIAVKDMTYIVNQRDTWALSDFDGFPAADLDLDLFAHQHQKVMRATPDASVRAARAFSKSTRKTELVP